MTFSKALLLISGRSRASLECRYEKSQMSSRKSQLTSALNIFPYIVEKPLVYKLEFIQARKVILGFQQMVAEILEIHDFQLGFSLNFIPYWPVLGKIHANP